MTTRLTLKVHDRLPEPRRLGRQSQSLVARASWCGRLRTEINTY